MLRKSGVHQDQRLTVEQDKKLHADILRGFGYADVRMLRDNSRSWSATATAADGRRVFLKVVTGSRSDVYLRSEAAFNSLVVSDPSAPFVVPATRLLKELDHRVLELEFVDAAWLDCRRPGRDPARPFDDDDHGRIYGIIRYLRSVPYERVPYELTAGCRACDRPVEAYLRTMLRWCDKALELNPHAHVLREARDFVRLLANKRFLLTFSLTHGDLPAKNLGRLPDGRLVVLDAEFAAWGLAWDDVVGLFLEMFVRETGRRPAAQALLRDLVARHLQDHPDDDLSDIVFPFVRLAVWYLYVAAMEKADMASASRAFEGVRSMFQQGGFTALLAP